jgi:hypothetical protein
MFEHYYNHAFTQYSSALYNQEKDVTRTQRISSIQNNNTRTIVSDKQLFKALPLKHHRRETSGIVSNPRTSVKIDIINQPNGVYFADPTDNCPNFGVNLDYNMKLCKSNNQYFGGGSITNSVSNCQTQEQNALRRVRSAGMYRPKFNQLNQKQYYLDRKEYLHARTMDYENNQTNNRTFQCPNNPNETYQPTYKPNNTPFATQGAVHSSQVVLRNKVDAINTTATSMIPIYGMGVANAIKYGVPTEGGTTAKEKAGYPTTLTPIIKENGEVEECMYYVVRR